MVIRLRALPAKWFCVGFLQPPEEIGCEGIDGNKRGSLFMLSLVVMLERRYNGRMTATLKCGCDRLSLRICAQWLYLLPFSFHHRYSFLDTHILQYLLTLRPSCGLLLSLARIWLSEKMPAGLLETTANFHC